MTHLDLCKLATEWLQKQGWCDLSVWELKLGRSRLGIADAIGVSNPLSKKHKRITIVEVKRTRSDLLQDLKKKKMLKYESTATHCYLLATEEALRLDKLTIKESLADLRKKGLPAHWGVLVSHNSQIKTIKPAKNFRTATYSQLTNICRKIGRKYMWMQFY